ncbi:MAG: nuclear transport factor 2 family protein [Actinophytocola sp.]|uniref:nuclear transport factor 2 family protein n=1 Tax=Actinophytocola sp. TaxID=1872138 RepID=UPI003C735274
MTDVVARYFEMWNSGDVGIAREVLSPGWVDHGHPEIDGVADVEHAVAAVRAVSPGLRFDVDDILQGDGDLVAVLGRVGGRRLVWVVRLADGLMAEMWTYTTSTLGGDD